MGGPCFVVNSSGKVHGPPSTDNFQIRRFSHGGVTYWSCEQAYQALKFGLGSRTHNMIAAIAPCAEEADSEHGLNCWSAGQAGQTRPGWESVKVYVMLEVNRAKYAQHEDLRAQLLSTGEAELQGGPSTSWRSPDGKHHNWSRWNGIIQMVIREELRPEGERRPGALAELLGQIAAAFPVPEPVSKDEPAPGLATVAEE